MPYSPSGRRGRVCARSGRRYRRRGRPGAAEVSAAGLVWPVVVVVLGVPGQDLAEVPLAEDQHVIQALAAKCFEPPGE